jgi:Icc-related predicted phosphoesterase
MKLQIVSDLHLEFNDNIVINNAGANILCLAGDICLAYHLYRHPDLGDGMPCNTDNGFKADQYRKFFNHVSKEFDRVLYIPGNHEYYSGRWNDAVSWLRDALDPWPNIVVIDNAWLNIGKTRVIGTTLWTDLNRQDPLTMMSMPSLMNDYRAITINRNGVYHKLRAIDTVTKHIESLELIKLGTETWNGNVVILGHHAPSNQSIHSRYKHEQIMNGAFCSNLDEYILSQEKIKLWIHGHVHNPFDYMIGDCRVVCNPHGYPREHNTFNPNLIVEI